MAINKTYDQRSSRQTFLRKGEKLSAGAMVLLPYCLFLSAFTFSCLFLPFVIFLTSFFPFFFSLFLFGEQAGKKKYVFIRGNAKSIRREQQLFKTVHFYSKQFTLCNIHFKIISFYSIQSTFIQNNSFYATLSHLYYSLIYLLSCIFLHFSTHTCCFLTLICFLVGNQRKRAIFSTIFPFSPLLFTEDLPCLYRASGVAIRLRRPQRS